MPAAQTSAGTSIHGKRLLFPYPSRKRTEVLAPVAASRVSGIPAYPGLKRGQVVLRPHLV